MGRHISYIKTGLSIVATILIYLAYHYAQPNEIIRLIVQIGLASVVILCVAGFLGAIVSEFTGATISAIGTLVVLSAGFSIHEGWMLLLICASFFVGLFADGIVAFFFRALFLRKKEKVLNGKASTEVGIP